MDRGARKSAQGKIADAMEAVKRVDFLPDDQKHAAHIDAPLPIGYGQTNSQPYTVGFMLQLLDVQPSQKILDVGSGSGWTAGLLSYLVGDSGRVVGVERIPELVEFSRKNLRKYAFKNLAIEEAGTGFGWPGKAPYDRILVSAGATEIPDELVDQLKDGGAMVVPVHDSILRVQKTGKELDIEEYPGFIFVPLLPK